jgi:signal transduction histidine kinase
MNDHALKEFFWEKPAPASYISTRSGGEHQMSDKVLIRNVAWYIRLRWISISLLVLYYTASALLSRSDFFKGIQPRGEWPLLLALCLAFANTVFFLFSENIKLSKLFPPVGQLWAQIITDLFGIVIVVHYCGSVGTPSPFLYVLHIALACIFFPTKTSLVIPIMASMLYCGCVALEFFGMLTPRTIFGAEAVGPLNYSAMGPSLIWQITAVAVIFFLLWYMVSRLSKIIRLRESQLIRANEETRRTHMEKEKYSIQMTHQLKSPLDAIRSNISLLLYFKQHKHQELPLEAVELLQRIDIRAKGMTNLIVDVLKLSRLNTPMEKLTPKPVEIDVLIKEAIDEMKSSADNRGIYVETDIEPLSVIGVDDHFKMLIENLIANAIIYSFDGGTVRVSCRKGALQGALPVEAVFTVADGGIGIPEDKVPQMFDDYFRTKEAINHNSASTGIGLAIVKKVAQTYGIRLSVTSNLGKGTTVSALFPAGTADAVDVARNIKTRDAD